MNTANHTRDEPKLGLEQALPRGWQPLSPEHVRGQRFRETALGRRGYRPDEVEAFLARMAEEVQRWTTIHARDLAEINRLRDFFRNQNIDTEPARQRAFSSEAINILATAQQQADQLIADAKTHARSMQTDARSQAERVVVEARREAEAAAHAYRVRAGQQYSADREQVERLAAIARNILAAVAGATSQLDGATSQLDGASAQIRAVGDAFSAELTKLVGPPIAAPEHTAIPDHPTATGIQPARGQTHR